jgi:hypothetical protein
VAIGVGSPIKFKVEVNESATNSLCPATANCSGPMKEEDKNRSVRTSETWVLQGMLIDILIAIVIVVIAAALGLVVHPFLWFIAVFAILWLFVRRGSRSRSRL